MVRGQSAVNTTIDTTHTTEQPKPHRYANGTLYTMLLCISVCALYSIFPMWFQEDQPTPPHVVQLLLCRYDELSLQHLAQMRHWSCDGRALGSSSDGEQERRGNTRGCTSTLIHRRPLLSISRNNWCTLGCILYRTLTEARQ